MKKVLGLENWKKNPKVDDRDRKVEIHITLKYPPRSAFTGMTIENRKAFADDFCQKNFKKLLEKESFDSYKLIGTKRKPRGIQTTIDFPRLQTVAKHLSICTVSVLKLSNATEIKRKYRDIYYCIRMTVSIQIEGFTSGMQTWEDRFVLIKARSLDDAHKKLKKQEKTYATPYLNSDMRWVSFKIESYNGYFEADIIKPEDIDNPKGVEVFSVWKTRKLTKERAWPLNEK